jgi:hypothetical protein
MLTIESMNGYHILSAYFNLFYNTCFCWYWFLKPYQTIDHSNLFLPNKKSNQMRVVYLTYSMLGEFTPSYILHTRAFRTYLLGGLFTLQKILQGDGILHVKSLEILYAMVFYM